jgi:hypothetical protein
LAAVLAFVSIVIDAMARAGAVAADGGGPSSLVVVGAVVGLVLARHALRAMAPTSRLGTASAVLAGAAVAGATGRRPAAPQPLAYGGYALAVIRR